MNEMTKMNDITRSVESPDQFIVSGALNFANATYFLKEFKKLFTQDVSSAVLKPCFDLRGVSEVDSSALAVIFGWIRVANKNNQTLSIINSPEALLSLAKLYGVDELLPLV